MKKNNPFTKPSGVQKGSATMAARGDRKSQGPSRPNPSKTVRVMSKVMKAYPNGSKPSPQKVVKNNRSAKDGGKSMKFLPR